MSHIFPPTPVFKDPLVERNYHIVGRYLLRLIDMGLDFLEREYIRRNSENEFQKFSARSFYTFVLRDYIRNKVKAQVKCILNGAVMCIESNHVHNGIVDADYLDLVVRKKFHQYAQFDMSLLHTIPTHPGHLELKQISKLTFRISIIQAARLLNIRDENIKTYADLIRAAFPTMKECRHSLNAILSMIDQMVDCFERNMNMVQIPFYKPTYQTRDFEYVRRVYEYALKVLDDQVHKIYLGKEVDA